MKKLYPMSKKIALLVLLLTVGFLAGFKSAFASGTLTNVSVTADTYLNGATATYTVSFTTATDVVAPNRILYMLLPSGYSLSGASLSSVQLTINGTPAAVDTNVGWLTGTSAMIKAVDTVPAGSQVTIQIPGVTNPSVPGDYQFTWIRSADPGGNAVDDTGTYPTITITEPLVPFDGGDGTAEHPYQISTCTQLQAMAQHLSAEYTLTQDIDCSETATWNPNVDEWEGGTVGGTLIPDSYPTVTHTSITINNNGYFGFKPVGTNSSPFTGKLHGNDKKIKNLWIFRKTTRDNGLFGVTNGATIEHVVIDHAAIVGNSNVGALAGVASGGTISYVTSDTSTVRAYLSYYGGGIVGVLQNDGIIDHATVTGGAVHGSGDIIGGIIGYMQSGTLSNSSASADVDGGYDIGGAVGLMDNGTISDTHATGSSTANRSEYVVIKTGYFAGGFIGYMNGGTITRSYATGAVHSSGYYAGGFVGMVSSAGATISDSYATGNVTGVVEDFDNQTFTPGVIGGFAGSLGGNVQITDAYATGAVINPGDSTGGFTGISQCGVQFNRVYATGAVQGVNSVGGFSGSDGCEGPGSTFNQVYATGAVTATGNDVGGFLGHADWSTITDAYATGNVSGNENVGGFIGWGRFGSSANVYATGTITATGAKGGLFGFNDDTNPVAISHSFFDKDTSGLSDDHGGLPTETVVMKNTSLYTEAGWNFDTIWRSVTGVNNGYPIFTWQTDAPTDTTAPILTVTHALTGVIPASEALFLFRTNEVCDVQATPPHADDGQKTEIDVGPVSVGSDIVATLRPLNPGTTYSFTLSCRDAAHNISNTVQVGPFTVQQTGGGSTGAGTPWTPVTQPESKTTCDASQLLTQNMRAPARNGRYSAYTKGIVTEVKILQAHMNRLGFNAGPIDGILGKLTDGAIKRMQKYLGTPQDGLVGPLTRALINNSCGKTNHL